MKMTMKEKKITYGSDRKMSLKCKVEAEEKKKKSYYHHRPKARVL